MQYFKVFRVLEMGEGCAPWLILVWEFGARREPWKKKEALRKESLWLRMGQKLIVGII
jgi:hypothetical protein